MREKIFALLFLVTLSSIGTARPRTVYLVNEIKEAKHILKVEVLAIEDAIMTFKNLQTDSIQKVGAVGLPDSLMLSQEEWTSKSPLVGDTLIILINDVDRISLCAKKEGDYYRFWSPHFTMSIAFFYFQYPAIALNSKGKEVKKDLLYSCWDGCLYPKEGLERLLK